MVRLLDHKDSNCGDEHRVHFDATETGRGIAGPNLPRNRLKTIFSGAFLHRIVRVGMASSLTSTRGPT